MTTHNKIPLIPGATRPRSAKPFRELDLSTYGRTLGRAADASAGGVRNLTPPQTWEGTRTSSSRLGESVHLDGTRASPPTRASDSAALRCAADDLLTLTLRLLDEDEQSSSPETLNVLRNWSPYAVRLITGAASRETIIGQMTLAFGPAAKPSSGA